ncbi:head-tail adaptor protein [Streptosporangium sp. NPDC051023]|uniref:head-tail adaptor protein n=1 Tax=Streptosporangium sp. NPDC051023 TaxID=3155410 RepID=UPI00344C216B
MPVPLPQGETIVILRPTGRTRDSAGNYVPDGDREIPVPGCAAWPTGSTEQVEAQDQTTELFTVLAPYGADIRATDRVRLHGRVFTVQGEPQLWKSPLTGAAPGLEIRLERTKG